MQQKIIRSTLLDAPRTAKSMHIVSEDLHLERLHVVYAGDLRYPLGDRITALPLKEIGAVELRALPGSGARR